VHHQEREPVHTPGNRTDDLENQNLTPLGRPTMLRRIAPAVGLFFLAPLVAEYLLGNVPVSAIAGLFVLAPMYGGGAILVREIARRSGAGWPTILVLALAYGVLQPSLIDHSMFSPPSLEGLDYRDAAYVPVLGLTVAGAVAFPLGHAIWSIGVPIAIVETFVPDRRTEPWLGKFGMAVAGIAFLLGSALIFSDSLQTLPSASQMVGASAVVVALIVVAFPIGRRPRPKVDRPAPKPWLVGVVAFVASSAFFAKSETWPGVVFGLVLLVAMVVVFSWWSRRTDWGAAHRLGLAGGALLTYTWGGFVLTSLYGRTGAIDLIGQVVLALGAIVLLAAAIRTVRRTGGSA
jgi:hypothetical protein